LRTLKEPLRADRKELLENREMMEITAIGMGLMMTAVGVAVGGFMIQATLLMMGRALRGPTLATSFEPAAIHLT
jgi:hypothetical protein